MSFEDLKEQFSDLFSSLSERFPNFPIIIAIVAILGVLGFFFLGSQPQLIAVLAVVENPAGAAIRGAEIRVIGLEQEIRAITDADGKALLEIPAGKNVQIEVSKLNYESQKIPFSATKEDKLKIVLRFPQVIIKDVTFTFAGPDGKKLIGKEVLALLSCSGDAEFEINEYTVNEGELKVAPPQNCGKVNVVASSSGLQTATLSVLGREQVIDFKAIEKPKGSLEVKVKDSEKKFFLDGKRVKLLDELGQPTGFSSTTSFGEVFFAAVEIGTYTLIVDDTIGEYGSESLIIEIIENSTARKEVLLSKDIKLKPVFKVMSGNEPVEGADIILQSSEGRVVLQGKTDSRGIISFVLAEAGTFSYIAYKDGFVPLQKNFFSTSSFEKASVQEFPVNLQKCAPASCGLVKVRVVDENNIAVENAKVSLLNSEGLVQVAYGYKVSDFNGVAQPFTGVGSGMYRILAQKFPAELRSDIVVIDPAKTNEFTLKIVIGSGTLRITAIDADNDPVAFADAEIFSDFGQRIGTIALDGKGEGSLSVKADKRVFAIVRKDGYAQHVSASKQIYPDKIATLSAKLEAQIHGSRPSIEFLGMFNAGVKVEGLKSGGVYTAKFLLRIPSAQEFETAEVFLRAGGKTTLSADNIWITSLDAPLAAKEKGSTFDSTNTNAQDSDLRNDSKWTKLSWIKPRPGNYEIEAEMRVRTGTIKGTGLPVYYRALGVTNSDYLRDPIDIELGNSENSESKQGLFAKSYERVFIEGLQDNCDLDFCFGTRLLDLDAGVYATEPYRAKTFSQHRLELNITNNSDILHDNASITIRNTKNGTDGAREVSIKSYSLENANSQKFSSNTESFEIGPLFMGSFTKNKSFGGTIDIEPKAANATALQFIIISGQQEVFNKILPLTGVSEDKLEVSLTPQNFVAFVPLDVNVSVVYATGDNKNFPVGGANVVVRKISPDRSKSVFTAATSDEGLAKLTIPPSSPGSRIVISVEKTGSVSDPIERIVSEQVVFFEPEKINGSLNRETSVQARTLISMKSNLAKNLVVKKIRVSGNLQDLLDQERMDSFLAQYVNSTIAANSEKDIEFLFALGNEAEFIERPLKVTGTLLADIALAEDVSKTWVLRVPFEVEINLADLPVNSPCIIISKSEWSDATLSGQAAVEFEIEDNCVSNQEQAVELENLQAQVEWHGKDGIVGQIELSVTDPVNGEIASGVLQQGIWSRLLERLLPNTIYPAKITFIPKPDTIGKTAQFSIKIDAQLETNAGAQFVGTNTSIDSQIVIADLDQCINISPHPEEGIYMDKDSDLATFTIDTSDCGPIPLDLRFCGGEGDNFCRGKTAEGGITVRPLSYTNVTEGSRQVTVERQDIPGFYGLTVEARPSGGSWRMITEIDTIIEPEEGRYFSLDKYEFSIIGKGGVDSARLTNEMLLEDVEVSANKCDWAGAAKKGNFSHDIFGGEIIPIPIYYFVKLHIAVFKSVFGSDPCDGSIKRKLQDYVINLAGDTNVNGKVVLPDAIDVNAGKNGISADWNIDIADEFSTSGNHGREQVGITFENTAIEGQNSVYSVVNLRAKEHVHGDPTHKEAKVRCQTSDFGMFYLNPITCTPAKLVYDTVYSQKFHLKFNVSEEKASLPKINFDTYACQSGVEIGRTGKGAMPRVKLDWKWKSITMDACDSANQDYVYCDATQFTISVNKRLYALYEFLQQNNFDLKCPKVIDRKASDMAQIYSEDSNREVVVGTIGVREARASEENKAINVVAKVSNKTGSSQDADVKVIVNNIITGFDSECNINISSIGAGEEKSGSCTVNTLDTGIHVASVSLESASTLDLVDMGEINTAIIVGDPYGVADSESCDLKTTATVNGLPQIIRFVENNPAVKWTSSIPNKNALLGLLVFDAHLIKDSYSKDFFNDFSRYYSETAFEDTDFYFHRLLEDRARNSFGLNRLMENGRLKLSNKYVDSQQLSSAGKYGIEIAVDFSDNSWRMFDPDGIPKASVNIIVHRKDDPSHNSPFYSMPFDGLVGIEADKYSRENYGVAYSNDEEPVYIVDDTTPVKSYSDIGSSPITEVDVKEKSDIYSLNTSPLFRGMVLQVVKESEKQNIIFQPSHATPVMMKISKTPTEKKFSSFYGVVEDNSGVDAGSSLAYWSGAGTCLDFTGIAVTESFYEKPDRKATEADRISDEAGVYALDWEKSVKRGDLYLRTIFYTNPEKDITLRSYNESDVVFLTPDREGPAVGLNGISNMPYNNFAAGSLGKIESIADVLQMVSEGLVCTTNNGTSTKFSWNPQAIYNSDGYERNISKETNKLTAGLSCIG